MCARAFQEAIVRPLSETQNDPVIGAMSTFLNAFMPRECGFVVNRYELAAHRLDAQTEAQLHAANHQHAQPSLVIGSGGVVGGGGDVGGDGSGSNGGIGGIQQPTPQLQFLAGGGQQQNMSAPSDALEGEATRGGASNAPVAPSPSLQRAAEPARIELLDPIDVEDSWRWELAMSHF